MHLGIFEAIMLLCFGAAWPFSIYRSWKSRKTGGKSPVFLIIVIVGYIAGIINKLLTNPDLVLWLYVLNAVMVGIDLILYLRNRAYEKKAGQTTSGYLD